MRFVYLIGPPGVGKTTALAALVEPWGMPAVVPAPLKHLRWPNAIVLGWPREGGFGGTDTWPYSAPPVARKWLATHPAPFVVGEGDRLAQQRTLEELEARVVYLFARPDALAARRAGRTQNPTWVKGRETKCRRLADVLGAYPLDVTDCTPAQVAAVVRGMLEV